MTDKSWYINYFTHMEKEHLRIPLGGMAWDDVCYHANATIQYNIFTQQELEERWPKLFSDGGNK